jgi:UDP:flavonoid glycosyltransferase YjiC (YdhE family)
LGSVSHAGFVDLERKRNSVEIVDDTYDVVITGGSARTASARFFEVALSACARLQLKSCVISRFEDLLPKTLWGSMTHRTWVEDLSSVLSGSRVAIHHGGMGSVAAACAAGVPQIVMASGGDRPENGRRIHSLKLGSLVPVGSWNVDSVSRRIQHVLDDERFQRRAAAARRLVSRSRAADHASRTLLNVLCV